MHQQGDDLKLRQQAQPVQRKTPTVSTSDILQLRRICCSSGLTKYEVSVQAEPVKAWLMLGNPFGKLEKNGYIRTRNASKIIAANAY